MFHLRLQQQTGALEKPSVLRLNRREVARIETILTERVSQTSANEGANGRQEKALERLPSFLRTACERNF